MNKRIKIAIVGIKGLPPRYGGFETLADNLIKKLNKEFDFIVYNSRGHINKKRYYYGARIINIPLNANGFTGLFFDTIALFHAWLKYDVILYLGPGVGWLLVLNKLFKKKIITNHGGLDEWNREKLNRIQKHYAYFNHKYASLYSTINVVDNLLLKKSLYNNFLAESIVIKYGGDHVSPYHLTDEMISKYPFVKEKYAISVSRAQIDNKLHLLLYVFTLMPMRNLVLISNWKDSAYGIKLKKQYLNFPNIYMIDAVYNNKIINTLRANADVYIHTQSQCGTSPSLIEAMSIGLPIIAYDIPVNRETTNNKAIYYSNAERLKELIESTNENLLHTIAIKMEKIANQKYKWNIISKQYANIFRVNKIIDKKI